MNKTAFLIVLGALLIAALIYLLFDGTVPVKKVPGATDVEIVNKWELPGVLEEISGIAYLGNNKIACIQDQAGIIFIYNLKTSSIVKEIKFGKKGDYEAITLVGTTAYVLSSEGTIFEIKNFENEYIETTTHELPLAFEYNFEGLGYDENNNRLLITYKEKSGKEFQPIFSFDLETMEFNEEPVFKIEFNEPVFTVLEQKISDEIFRPSELTVHQPSGKIYILEAEIPKLLILNSSGKVEKLHVFNFSQFNQAEGLTFGENGEMYISNENKGGTANILQVKLN